MAMGSQKNLMPRVSGVPQDVSEFEVKSLPDAPQLPQSWAGRLSIPGTETGNSLFFWLFEAEDMAYDDNLIGMYTVSAPDSLT
jgi:hypothetical protein